MHVDTPQRPTFRSRAAGNEFPQDETTRVHVNAQERITTEVYCSFEDLRSHVAAGSHLQQPMSEQLQPTMISGNFGWSTFFHLQSD